MTLDDFVAPEGDFEMEFEVRAAGSSTLNQSDITIRKQGAYEISLVFESKDKSTTTISSEYTKQDANTPKAEVKSNTFYTYRPLPDRSGFRRLHWWNWLFSPTRRTVWCGIG